ncbi:sigma-70 family RNA polymerase sigma factor [Streptomyces sp. NPDC085612]|uniref:sigma-70 family RNA polymerase sigma factor n=1 Tax=Streptomyces sp. NPDC085612 TaxID=3365732 RepID=UPI0037CFDB85
MTEIPAQRGGPPPREIIREAYRAAESAALASPLFRALPDDNKSMVLNEASVCVLMGLAEAPVTPGLKEVTELLTDEVFRQIKILNRKENLYRRNAYPTTYFDHLVHPDDPHGGHDPEGPDGEPPESGARDQDRPGLAPEELEAFWTVLRSTFRGRQLAILEMRYSEEGATLSEEKIAERLGVSRRTVRTALERAQKKFPGLREALRPLGQKTGHIESHEEPHH